MGKETEQADKLPITTALCGLLSKLRALENLAAKRGLLVYEPKRKVNDGK